MMLGRAIILRHLTCSEGANPTHYSRQIYIAILGACERITQRPTGILRRKEVTSNAQQINWQRRWEQLGSSSAENLSPVRAVDLGRHWAMAQPLQRRQAALIPGISATRTTGI